jgi:hypothetical protein
VSDEHGESNNPGHHRVAPMHGLFALIKHRRWQE